eukprot:gb/GECG01008484.1/.p1 GENE.gb/GECG01008484.1/~~gb/GECG01008484.1/.p1  ORF type:complete len:477 (+),score=45.92 gb/GECG01008484.1/:1-1431(+)
MAATESYEPSTQVQWLHERTRYTTSFGAAPQEFPDSFGGSDSNDWVIGCVMWTGIFAFIGLLFTLILMIGYCLTPCCCSSKKRDMTELKNNPSNPKPYNKRFFIITLGLSALFFIFALATFAPISSFDDGFNRALDGIESAQTTLQEITDVGGKLVDLLGGAADTTDELADDVNSNGPMEDALRDFASAVRDTQSTASSAIGTAQDLVDSIGDVVQDGRDSSDKYGETIAFAYAGLMCSSAIILMITLIPKSICTCPHKFIGVPVNLMFLLLLWMFTGIWLTLGMMSADFCVAPNQNTIDLFGSGSSGNSVRYYLSCDPDKKEVVTPDDGLRYEIQQTLEKTETLIIDTYGEAVREVEGHNNGNNNQVVEDFKKLNETFFQPALVQVRKLDEIASCKSIRRTWDIFIQAFCRDFISDGIIVLFGLQTFMAVLLFLIMLFNWSFCLRHPGRSPKHLQDTNDWGADKMATVVNPTRTA